MADVSLLQAALLGYQKELERLDAAMAEIRKRIIGRTTNGKLNSSGLFKKNRTMSAAARKRIADAQRLRWAKFRARNPK